MKRWIIVSRNIFREECCQALVMKCTLKLFFLMALKCKMKKNNKIHEMLFISKYSGIKFNLLKDVHTIIYK